MLETSKDLLWLLLGISIFMIACFSSWVIYQIGRSIKGINNIIQKGQSIANSVDQGVKELKDKSGHAAAYISLFIKGGLEILKSLQNRREKNKSRSKK
ncbi:MAG: hypothetical protein C3F02_00600 [Parcubacteria group bacterium]|nr:MAG: hypothetical protein C3F02_00600 [Parcubacteria group bacterium]